MAVFKAMIMTKINRERVPKDMLRGLQMSKRNGGFGIWYGGRTYSIKGKQMPRIKTTVQVSKNKKFGVFGSAKMSDPMIQEISEMYSVSVETLAGERSELIGSVLESGITGHSKYRYYSATGSTDCDGNRVMVEGSRLNDNLEAIMRHVETIPSGMNGEIHVRLDLSSRNFAKLISDNLIAWFQDVDNLRHRTLLTPRDCVDRVLSKSGCITEAIYSKVNGLRGKEAYLKHCMARFDTERGIAMRNEIVKNYSWKEQKVFLEGDFGMNFYRPEERINVEVAALIKSYTIMCVACRGRRIGIERLNREVNEVVLLELVMTEVAREVWMNVEEVLSLLAF
jgi:hypothetical protein